jgi:hypothetical protein
LDAGEDVNGNGILDYSIIGVQDWTDKWATVTIRSTDWSDNTATANLNGLTYNSDPAVASNFGTITYTFDNAVAGGALVDDVGFRPPLSPELLYQG